MKFYWTEGPKGEETIEMNVMYTMTKDEEKMINSVSSISDIPVQYFEKLRNDITAFVAKTYAMEKPESFKFIGDNSAVISDMDVAAEVAELSIHINGEAIREINRIIHKKMNKEHILAI